MGSKAQAQCPGSPTALDLHPPEAMAPHQGVHVHAYILPSHSDLLAALPGPSRWSMSRTSGGGSSPNLAARSHLEVGWGWGRERGGAGGSRGVSRGGRSVGGEEGRGGNPGVWGDGVAGSVGDGSRWGGASIRCIGKVDTPTTNATPECAHQALTLTPSSLYPCPTCLPPPSTTSPNTLPHPPLHARQPHAGPVRQGQVKRAQHTLLLRHIHWEGVREGEGVRGDRERKGRGRGMI